MLAINVNYTFVHLELNLLIQDFIIGMTKGYASGMPKVSANCKLICLRCNVIISPEVHCVVYVSKIICIFQTKVYVVIEGCCAAKSERPTWNVMVHIQHHMTTTNP